MSLIRSLLGFGIAPKRQVVTNDADNSFAEIIHSTAIGFHVTVSNTRPADTTGYTAGDALGANTGSAIIEFTNVGAAGEHVLLTDAMLRFDLAALPSGMSTFTLHFYDAGPTAIADNAAFDLVSGDRTKYLGAVEFDIPVDRGSTLIAESSNINKRLKLASGSTSLFAILVTDAAWTPTSAAALAIRIGGISLAQ